MTKSVYAAVLIALTSILGFTFPFLPRHLTIAAFLTIGIPSFVLALAPSEGPLYRGRLLKALAAFAVPAGVGIAAGSMLSFFFVDKVGGGTIEEGRTAATTTLIVLGLCFILLLERGPGREHITIQTYMLAMIAVLGAVFAAVFALGPVRDFFELELLSAGQWFLSLLAVAVGLVIAGFGWRLPLIQDLDGWRESSAASAGWGSGGHAQASRAARRRRDFRDERPASRNFRHPAHQDRVHHRSGHQVSGSDVRADRRRRRRVPPQLLARDCRRARRERDDDPRSRTEVRQGDRHPR